MGIMCRGCDREKKSKLNDVKDPENYYCKSCLSVRMHNQKSKRQQDWSTIRKLNAIAMANGHESLFKVRREYLERTGGTDTGL